MDEERIERALRHGPIDEPAYRASFRRGGEASEASSGMADDRAWYGRPVPGARAATRGSTGGFRFAGAFAAAIAVVAILLVLRPDTMEGPGASQPSDLLAQLRSAGAVRIAVTNGHPQTTAGGDVLVGFDVDVARAVAQELGLREEVVGLPSPEIQQGSGSWSLALPSTRVTDGAGLTAGPNYYGWPVWLVVPTSSSVQTQADLGSLVVCAVTGSGGNAWLQGAIPDAVVAESASDANCITAMESGDAAGAVTATLLADDIANRGLRPLGEKPAYVEPRGVLVRGTGSDIATLVRALDEAIADLRVSGRLAELSRSAFGGQDLSTGVQP